MLEAGLQKGSQGRHFGQRPEDFLALEGAVLGIPQLFELSCAVWEKGSQWPESARALQMPTKALLRTVGLC